ncbi:MAG: hypothetical protein GOP50_12435 [Candidatus Heimdallarchaeota archaeon]|nr:hypothetical protein [Candidatus Heimdallarchaeota archaeon]
MKLCSIDTSLNEEVKAKTIAGTINLDVAQVKINIVKKRGPGLDRKTLERSHVLFISLPRKKISQEEYIELISYIDIGGCLVLTLPSPPWTDLGRFFEEFRKEIGISFQSKYVYGLPKIPNETRLIGSQLTITKAHVINAETDEEFLKENGIKELIPLALMDDEPVVMAAYKRRGRFVIFSSPEIFDTVNSDFLSRLILLSSKKESYTLSNEIEKIQIGSSNFSMLLQHACLDSYLLSLYHYNFAFHKEIISLEKESELPQRIYSIILKQKVLSERPKQEDILETLQKFKVES